ncbi:class I SAM-dependent methyltransferase [Leptospira limi]|uniref:Class I SAM-dependent methyltransferase n=1 Tax=Leptospira limi TaxID=2950023 RepID=A0ABT3LZ21_9LEPT|nr:class I SAM-dependent methyltransferase [Leptospira limi]MCW7462971.1 class I SAM-dependent methyltransferase [Leptospira limi]
MNCYICSSEKWSVRPGKVRDNPSLEIRECSHCGLVYLSSQIQSEEEFYQNSGMHDGNVPIDEWIRNTEMDDNRRFQDLRLSLPNQTLLDFGCGNGAFLKLVTPLCKEVAGVELEKRLQPYFLSQGLKVYESLSELEGEYDWITAFHVIEHLSDPVPILKKLSMHLKSNSGKLLVEVPSSQDALLTLYGSIPFQEFTYWSCHLYLYNEFTLRKLAEMAGLKVQMIKQIQRYPLSNHLYWLSKSKPGGHKAWPLLNNPDLQSAYANVLASIGACDTISAILVK